MGRKGGGRKGFMKAAQARHDSDSEPEEESKKAAATKPEKEEPAAEKKSKKKAVEPDPSEAFLADEPSTAGQQADDADSSDEDAAARKKNAKGETRGQVLQRHKREQKELKTKIKAGGKKKMSKDDAKKAEEEMNKRQATEVAFFDERETTMDEVVAATDSMYQVHLTDDGPKKMSKAQKRKQKLAEAELAREKEIEEEKAAMGDSERKLEEEALAKALSAAGLAIHEIPADGNCMYSAVRHQLQLHGEGDPPSQADLRGKTAGWMRSHADDFLPFMLDEAGDEDPQAYFEKYCNKIETTAAWGGQVEMTALAAALERHIAIHTVGMPVVHVGEEHKEACDSLAVCYQRHAYGLGEHYNSTIPLVEGDYVIVESGGNSEGDQ